MQQHADAPAASAAMRHARRALLVLGGAFVWWLVFLSGGSAQADDNAAQPDDHDAVVSALPLPARPSHEPAKAGEDLKGYVRQATSTVTTTVRATPHTVTSTVEATTAAAPEPIRTTVAHLSEAVEPALTSTTTTLADTVERTVDAVGPVVDPVLQTLEPSAPGTSIALPRIATTHGPGLAETRGQLDPAPGTTTAAAPATASSEARPVGPADDHAPVVPSPSAPSAPAPTTASGAQQGGAFWTMAAIIAPATLRGRHGRRDDTVPTGPAYEPDSSPD
jgi:hypothetical protein